MEMSQFKRSVQEIARTVGALVEEKLGERSQLEEQVKGIARQVEKVVSETIWNGKKVPVRVKFKRLQHFKGELPSYATSGASGLDVRACVEQEVVLQPMQRTLIPTGLSVEIPNGFEIQVRPRSGLAIKQGLTLLNTPGTVDADYRGEVKIIMINLSAETVTIKDQDRIAQLVLCPVVQCEVVDASDLSDTERGAGGFGSTGV
jgi:dUTP pyrophosphatase